MRCLKIMPFHADTDSVNVAKERSPAVSHLTPSSLFGRAPAFLDHWQ
jgi:hypothetical protein